MPDKDLNQRVPFGIDENAVKILDEILSRAANDIAEHLHRNRSGKGDTSEWGKKNLESDISRIKTIEYVVSCSYRTSDHRLDLTDFINFPNYDHAQIDEMSVSVGNYNTPKIQLILQTDPDLYTNMRCKISGDYSFINHYGNELQNWLLSVRKKYWPAYKLGVPISIGLMTFLAAFMLLGLFSRVALEGDETGWKKSIIIGVLAGLVGVFFSPVPVLIGRRMFPIGEFAVGRGAARQKRREHVVYYVFGGAIVLGLAVSIFGNLLTSVITTTGATH
jgi:hypothetical protein